MSEVVTLDLPGGKPQVVEVTEGSISVRLRLARTASGLTLLGASDTFVNRCPISECWSLNHGDVISVGPVHLLVVDPDEDLWLPEPIEAAVFRAGVTEDALSVAWDALRGLGHPGRPLGALRALHGRGLVVRWRAGFADALEVHLEHPMVNAWRRRWFRLVEETRSLQFVRQVTVREAPMQSPLDLEIVAAELLRLDRALPCLEMLSLSAGFLELSDSMARQLARFRAEVVVDEIPQPVPEENLNEWADEPPRRLFGQPEPSSWYNQTP